MLSSQSNLFVRIRNKTHFSERQAFTLTELIVIITILAILGTIGFITLQNSASKSRDSSRIATIRTAVTGITTRMIDAGKYPIPDGLISTGSINGVEVAYKGDFGESIGRNIQYSFPLPKDPLTGTPLPYGVSFDRKYFQIAATLENRAEATNVSLFVDEAYAAVPASAKVSGSYLGFVKFSSGSLSYIANLPSLIWFGSGTINLTPPAPTVRFVRDGGSNVAYVFGGTQPGNETPEQAIQSITKSTVSTFTGTDITSVTDSASLNTVFTGTALANYGLDILSMESVVLGRTKASPEAPTGGIIDGVCNNSVVNSCSIGSVSNQSPGSCGGSATWKCLSSGGGADASCSKANSACAGCSLPGWGGGLAHGQSVTSYTASSVSCGGSCATSNISCNNGTLSGGSVYYASCSVQPCCKPSGFVYDNYHWNHNYYPTGTTISTGSGIYTSYCQGSSVASYTTYPSAFNSCCSGKHVMQNNGIIATAASSSCGVASYTYKISCQ